MTYYRGERYNSEKCPPSDGASENYHRTRTSSAGIIANSSRTGPNIPGRSRAAATDAPGRVNAQSTNYPRMRSASESILAAVDGAIDSGYAIINPGFLNACREGDDNRLRQLMTSRILTPGMVNHRDTTGKTGVNLICAIGNLSLLELISSIPTLDINLGDNEGNTPLHFVSQAGHVEILHFLLNQFKNLQIDARNNLGFTALMKASLQGRTKCVKLLLAAGASTTLRDYGRGFCAYEWARYCCRQPCAEMIEKFMKNCKCSPATLRKQLKDLEKWNSEPNLQFFNSTTDTKDSWLKQKLKKALFNRQTAAVTGVNSETSRKTQIDSNYSVAANLSNVTLCASSPVVPTASNIKTATSSNNNYPNRTSICANGDAVNRSIPKLQITEFNSNPTSSTPNRNFNYNSNI